MYRGFKRKAGGIYIIYFRTSTKRGEELADENELKSEDR